MSSPPRLPGRHALLKHVRHLTDDPLVHMIALTGAAGMGKSAVVEALEASLEPDHLVLGHACRGGLPGAGGALEGLLSRLHRVLGPQELARLAEEPGLRPLLARVPTLNAQTGDLAAGAVRYMPLLESIVALLDRLCRLRPVVLLVDDVQHMDEASRSLVEGLLAHPALDELRVTLVVACRELSHLPFIADWQRLLGPMPGLQVVDVPPLNEEAVAELVARELDESAARLPDLVARLTALSNGHPFLALHLLRAARRQGVVRASFKGWTTGSLEELALTASRSLVELAAAPVLERGPQARFLLSWLEVAGRPVSLAPLAEASDRHEEDWVELARELQALGVLHSIATEDGERHWAFTHALWAEASRGLLESAERKETLTALAAALEARGASEDLLRAEILCRAWSEEQDTTQRLECSRKASDLLAHMLRTNEAHAATLDLRLRLAERLVQVASDNASYSLALHALLSDHQLMGSANGLAQWLKRADVERLEGETRLLWLTLMPRAFTIGGRSSDLDAWLQSMEQAPWLTEVEQAALHLARLQWRYAASEWEGAADEFLRLQQMNATPVQRAWGRCLHHMMPLPVKDDAALRFKLLEQLLLEVESLLDDNQRMAVLFELQNLAHMSGQRPLMKPHHPHMVELARNAGASSMRIHRERLARALRAAGQLEEAEGLLRENLDHALRHGERLIAAEMTLTLVNLLRQQRRLEDALAVADLLGEDLDQAGGSYAQVALLLTVLSTCWRLHRLERAVPLLEAAERLMETSPVPELRLSFLYSRVMVRLQQAEAGGSWSDVARAATDMMDFYSDLGRTDTEALLFALVRDRALVHLHGTDPSRRAADYLPAVATAVERREYDLVRFLAHMGELALLTGECEVLHAVDEHLRVAGRDEELVAAFRLSRACGEGRLRESAHAMVELCCHAATRGQQGLVSHARLRFPRVVAWPLPGDLPARELCHFAWTVAETLGTARFPDLPGLIPDTPYVAQVQETVEVLKARRVRLPVDERRRLDVELDRLSSWLEGRPRAQAIRLELLGGPRLLVGGEQLDPSQMKTRVGIELMALLAVRSWQGQASLSREKILEALSLNGRALLSEGSLRVVVSRLRKGLQGFHSDSISGQDRQGYSLALPVALDVADFENAWTKAQDARRNKRPGEAAHHFDACISLYQGVFLPGGAGWTEPLRAHFERRVMDAVSQRLALMEDEKERSAWLDRLRARLPELAEYLPA